MRVRRALARLWRRRDWAQTYPCKGCRRAAGVVRRPRAGASPCRACGDMFAGVETRARRPRHPQDTPRAAQRSILPDFLNALAPRRQDIPGASDVSYFAIFHHTLNLRRLAWRGNSDFCDFLTANRYWHGRPRMCIMQSSRSRGDIAQLGERGVRNAEVGGSSPPISTTFSLPSLFASRLFAPSAEFAALWILAFAGMTGVESACGGCAPWERGRPARIAALARAAPSS